MVIESRPPTAYETLSGLLISSFRIPGQGQGMGKVETSTPRELVTSLSQPHLYVLTIQAQATLVHIISPICHACTYSPQGHHTSPKHIFTHTPLGSFRSQLKSYLSKRCSDQPICSKSQPPPCTLSSLLTLSLLSFSPQHLSPANTAMYQTICESVSGLVPSNNM